MSRSRMAVVLVGITLAGIAWRAPLSAQDTSGLAGRWALDRERSQWPREIGFGLDVMPSSGSGTASTGSGGRGRGRSGRQSPSVLSRPESQDDARREQQLTAEVRTPPESLTIVETPSTITITDEQGHSRTFRPNGKEDVLQLDQVPVAATETRAPGRLVILYQVADGRQLRYTYSRTLNPPQLFVDVEFIERSGHDAVRRTYIPASASETRPSAPSSVPASGQSAVPTSPDRIASSTVPQQPDAELRGLKTLGIVVEGLTGAAAACGLNQSAIEAAVSTSLSDHGLTVVRRVDQEPYLYVNIVTSSVSAGLCVSRYDAFLYTFTKAGLPFHEAPVLVQVSLLHKGGMAGGSPAAHADAVLQGVREYVDEFGRRIQDANK